MLPKWHALFGFVFSYVLYWFTSISILEAGLIFFSSILIDFDHYIWYVAKRKDWSLKNAHIYLKKLSKQKHKPRMDIFHTIEFHIFVGLLIFFWSGFFYILTGMVFHSTLDIIDIFYNNKKGSREFSLTRYLILNKKNPDKYL